jgi:hypothetical protein
MLQRAIASLALFLALAAVSASRADTKEPAPLTAPQIEAVWTDFGMNDDDGTHKALEGMAGMIATPKLAVPFLKARLKPVVGPDPQRVQQCIADLDAKDFKTREKADKDLEAFGPFAATALEKALQEKPPIDLAKRLEKLLKKTEQQVLSLEELRAVRAIEVLRGIGGAEAKAVLEPLAKGADASIITVQARQALAALAPK